MYMLHCTHLSEFTGLLEPKTTSIGLSISCASIADRHCGNLAVFDGLVTVVAVVNLLVRRSISVNLECDVSLNRRCRASAEYGLFGNSIAFFHFICSLSAIDPNDKKYSSKHIKTRTVIADETLNEWMNKKFRNSNKWYANLCAK